MNNLKLKRHSKIIELITQNDVETQEELTKLLSQNGFCVTQATISRDIRELSLTKIVTGEGKQKYAICSQDGVQISERLLQVFVCGVVSISCSENIIVIKTLSGMAMAVGAAVDAMGLKDILGTIAGDDTIFCVISSQKKTGFIAEKLKKAKNGQGVLI